MCIEYHIIVSARLSYDEIPTITYRYHEKEASVFIKWQCNFLKGPISHDIVVTCVSQLCAGDVIEYIEDITSSTITVTFNVINYQTYKFKLQYWRGSDSRSKEVKMLADRNFGQPQASFLGMYKK